MNIGKTLFAQIMEFVGNPPIFGNESLKDRERKAVSFVEEQRKFDPKACRKMTNALFLLKLYFILLNNHLKTQCLNVFNHCLGKRC